MRSNRYRSFDRKQSFGFTLVELVVGMTVLAIAFAYLESTLFKLFENSVDPMFKVRAAELGQAYMEEISSKRFDHNTPSGGRCGELGTTCTAIANLGPESGETRLTYNDVDDYDGLDTDSSGGPQDALGNLRPEFSQYRVQVSVVYDDDYDGNAETTSTFDAKLIAITVTDPRGDQLQFAAYRGNF